MLTTSWLTRDELADYLAASPLPLTLSPTPQDVATAVAEDLLTHRLPWPTLDWEAGRYPEGTRDRRLRSRRLVDDLGVDKLHDALDDVLLSVRALTIRQPWAGAVTHLGKRTENRSWRSGYRGLVLLHAAKEADTRLITQARQSDPDLPLHRQAVIATAKITGCHQARRTEQGGICCSPWGEPGLWHWEIKAVHPLARPVSCSGALNLWRPSADVLNAVLAVEEEGR